MLHASLSVPAAREELDLDFCLGPAHTLCQASETQTFAPAKENVCPGAGPPIKHAKKAFIHARTHTHRHRQTLTTLSLALECALRRNR